MTPWFGTSFLLDQFSDNFSAELSILKLPENWSNKNEVPNHGFNFKVWKKWAYFKMIILQTKHLFYRILINRNHPILRFSGFPGQILIKFLDIFAMSPHIPSTRSEARLFLLIKRDCRSEQQSTTDIRFLRNYKFRIKYQFWG